MNFYFGGKWINENPAMRGWMDGWLDGCMYGWVHGGKENHFVFIKQNTNKKRNAACVFSLIKSFELTEKKKKQKTITITNQ